MKVYGKEPAYKLVAINDIEENDVQPEARTAEGRKSLKRLRDALELTQIWAPPIVVWNADRKKYIPLDGHRRIHLADEHATHIWVQIVKTPLEPEPAFVQLNIGNEPFGPAIWWGVWSLAAQHKRDLLGLPVPIKRNIESIAKWLGSTRASAKWGKKGELKPNYIVAAVAPVIAAGERLEGNSRSAASVALSPDEIRELTLQVLYSTNNPKPLKNNVRHQIVALCQSSDRTGTVNSKETWEGCDAGVYRREIAKILSSDVLSGNATLTLKP